MESIDFVIDKDYWFGTNEGEKDGPLLHLSLVHDQVMEMGKFFLDNNPYEMELGKDFGLKDVLDNSMARHYAQYLFENYEEDDDDEYDEEDEYYEDDEYDDEFEDENEEEEEQLTVEDFYDKAWDMLAEIYYYCWPDDLKNDCIEYYKSNL